MYAAHKVEQGIKLVTLEQLISSHSVGGAIKQPFMLRTFNWTTLMLFFIWCLSPLAGQAILRMSDTVDNWDPINTTVAYFSTNTIPPIDRLNLMWAYQGVSDDAGSGDAGSVDDSPPPWFESSILTALVQGYSQTINNTQDVYRNLRIPVDQGSAPFHVSNITYSSLLGYPFWINDTSNNPEQETQFSMVSSYFAFSCSDLTVIDAYGDIMQSHNLSFNINRTMTVSAENSTSVPYISYNGTQYSMEPGPTGVLYYTTFSESKSANYCKGTEILDGECGYVYFSRCPYQTIVMNTTFDCTGVKEVATCAPSNSTRLPELESQAMPLGYYFPSVMQHLGDTNAPHDYSQAEQFIVNTAFAAHQDLNDDTRSWGGAENVTGAQLSERLGLIVNTVWSLGLDERAFIGPDQQIWNQQISTNITTGYATGPLFQQYIVFWPWLVLLVICSTILLAAAIAAAFWEHRVVGPDFLGFANTAVKKSVKMPKSLSTMDARDRLHALQQCEVILHDLKPDHPVGKIALGVKEDGTTRLVPGRQYR